MSSLPTTTNYKHDYEPLSVEPNNSGLYENKRINKKKRVLFHFIAVAAVMYAAFTGMRWVARSGAGAKWGVTKGCHHAKNYSTRTQLPTHYTLPSGDKIPSVALGVWQAGKGEVGQAVKIALDSGYRHIDGAWIYRNEEEVGQALKESSVPREDIWITSKLWNVFHAPEDVEPAIDVSLNSLGIDYLDLYIIHWPIAFKKGTNNEIDEQLTADPYPTWQALEALVDKGKVKNIGVSNFNIPRLENLTANPLKYRPAVNQVELNFWNPQPELVSWSKQNNLLLEAYSPLGSSQQVGKTLGRPEIQEVAKDLGITPAQVIISWHVQRGTVVLPKSVTPSRIKENYQVTALPEEAFAKIEAAATSHSPQRVVNPSKSWGLSYDLFDEYPY